MLDFFDILRDVDYSCRMLRHIKVQPLERTFRQFKAVLVTSLKGNQIGLLCISEHERADLEVELKDMEMEQTCVLYLTSKQVYPEGSKIPVVGY